MLNQSTTEKSAIKDAIAVGGVECNTSRNNNHSWNSHGTQINNDFIQTRSAIFA